MDLIKVAEEAFATGKKYPEFKAGDTITVAYKIIEGSKERIQLYRGVVIKISGHGDKKRFTVRKMSGTVGVERIFPILRRSATTLVNKKSNKERFHNRSLSFSFVVLIGTRFTMKSLLERLPILESHKERQTV